MATDVKSSSYSILARLIFLMSRNFYPQMEKTSAIFFSCNTIIFSSPTFGLF